LLDIDIFATKREIDAFMKQQRRGAQRKLDYPETTAGSRLAAKARKMASKLNAEQRREHLNAAMAMIYGGAKKTHSTLISFLISPQGKISPAIYSTPSKPKGTD
jgi:hypothetical protein